MLVGTDFRKGRVGSASGGFLGWAGRRLAAVSAAAIVTSLAMTSGALAQNCGPLPATGFTTNFDWKSLFGGGLSGANALAAAITAANTAFLTQSTVFVSSPGDAGPNSESGGAWVRGVGGNLTVKNSGTVSYSYNVPGFSSLNQSGSTSCTSKFQQDFGGVQVGQDVARLNVGGWNLHLGTTAGFLETTGKIAGGNTPAGGPFESTTQAPFVGTYLVATNGGFFVDSLVRLDYYETNLNSPSISVKR